VASVLKGVVAQRLLRRLCDACAVPVDVATLATELRPPADRPAPAKVRKALGCRQCNGRGYRGRIPVFEIMPVDESIGRLIDGGALPDVLAAAARKLGMRTLWETGLERVWAGDTSLDELTRVLGDHGADDSTPAATAVLTSAGSAAPAPARESARRSSSTPGNPEPGSEPVRILLADDDPQMRRLIKSVLQREGFEVVEAVDGLDALEAVERSRVDLVILDLEMPRLDGLGVLEELRAQMRTASLPVIVLTAQHGESEEKALDLGAQDYLTKPVQTRSLVARVRAVLKRVNS
jgi:CheY-like chemotaxis protein